jgi:hypothetical protein
MRAIIHLGFFWELFEPPVRLAAFIGKRIRQEPDEQRLARFLDHASRQKFAFKIPFHAHKPAAGEPNCRRIAVRPWHGRYSPSGDSSKRILVEGCSE